MADERAQDFLYSWNAPSGRLAEIQVEDDLRESLQSARVARPTVATRRRLLDLEAELGIRHVLLGFPAASDREEAECAELVAHIAEGRLDITPILMARAVPADVLAVSRIQESCGVPVLLDLYHCTSPIRRRVEGWGLSEALARTASIAARAVETGLRFRIAFEDSTRTPPEDLSSALSAIAGLGAEAVVLNDTAGACHPDGAYAHVRFVKDELSSADDSMMVSWHGHDDQGLALANALAAAAGGAELISGTFLGVGERAGNTPLEQLLYILTEAGNPRYTRTGILPVCEAFAQAVGTPIPFNAPVVGPAAFATGTGTHAIAILKASRLGQDFADLVYSAVSASSLGREQTFFIGPNSGRAGVREKLRRLGLASDDETVRAVLHHCKERAVSLESDEQVVELVRALSAER